MFLVKKNARYFNKPKNTDPNKPKRILPGWQSEEEQKKQKYEFTSTTTEAKHTPQNLLMGDQFSDLTAQSHTKKQNQNKYYFNWDEINQKSDIQCQKRLVQEIVQPGGIRIKPNDTMLNDFLKEVKGMEVHIIGSILLSKIQVNYPFQTKAKALYTIQFLVKKNEIYHSFFKAHVEKIKQFPEPEDNVENYRKILKSVLNVIGVPIENSNTFAEEPKQKYVDPGYNDDPKSLMSNFIQQNVSKVKKVENKKVIIGPGQSKSKVPAQKKQQSNNDLFNLDLLSTGPQQKQNTYEYSQQNVSFQQMLSGINLNGNQPQKNINSNNFLL